jgi:preprotein translocase subunit SecY
MAEDKKSVLYKLKPLIDRMPAVKKPEGHVPFKTKMYWTITILVFYYIMTNVFIYGLDRTEGGTIDLFSSFRAILAGAQGSILHLGIGPIVTGSIIMQLFTGAKIIKLDLTDTEDKAIYQGTQKVLVIVMIVVESIPQVFGYLNPSPEIVELTSDFTAKTIIVIQLCVGSYLVFLMDELVSKWGIGSGISLFIAAGVAQQIFTGTVNWEAQEPGTPIGFDTTETGGPNLPAGTAPRVYYALTHLSSSDMTRGGFQMVFIDPPNAVIALIGTIIVFIIVAYAESSRIELPLAHGKVRGARGRYPIRLVYASNIPVILIAALLANINMFTLIMWNSPRLEGTMLGHNPSIGAYEDPSNPSQPTGGFAFYVSTVNGLHDWLLPLWNDRYLPPGFTQTKVLLHVVVYLVFMIGGSIVFAKFWIETTNMGPEAVAKQIQSSGMQIPGFRRDPRVLKRVLERYIPVVTIISGAFVGALAAFADMIGTTGQSSGTGVLLMVGIIIRMYEQIGKEQAMEMHPVLRGFFGAE